MPSFILTSPGLEGSPSLAKSRDSEFTQAAPDNLLLTISSVILPHRFWKRASAHAHQATKERFVKAWRSYLDSVILQAQRRDKGRYICTIDEYMVSRRDNIGSDPSFAFLEMSLELDIPHYVMEHPHIVALNRDTTDMIVLANVSRSVVPCIQGTDHDR